MKNFFEAIITFNFSLLIFNTTYAQAPAIQWAKCLGGSMSEQISAIEEADDGSFFMLGQTRSDDFDVSGNNGSVDIWIVKTDNTGTILWQECIGGGTDEFSYRMDKTKEGGIIVCGWTNSNDIYVSGNHGQMDGWVVQLDSIGNVEWQHCYGGTQFEGIYDIHSAWDGGYILASTSNSIDGDVSGNHGAMDPWIVKIDSTGNIQWQKSFGGSVSDYCLNVQAVSDSGYLVSAYVYSDDGNVTGNHGDLDWWIAKLDTAGNIQWSKCYGGSYEDGAGAVAEIPGKGYFITGSTTSTDGDISSNHAGYECWVVHLDYSGNIVWETCLGGNNGDAGRYIHTTPDGGLVLCGGTHSNDGDVSGQHGMEDFWIVRLDSTGLILWQKCLGGSNNDVSFMVKPTMDGGYITCGYTLSGDGDVTGYHGGTQSDAWIVKLASDPMSITQIKNPLNNLSAQLIQSNMLSVSFSFDANTVLHLTLTDIAGRILLTQGIIATSGINKKEIRVGDLAEGVYLVSLSGDEVSESVKISKE